MWLKPQFYFCIVGSVSFLHLICDLTAGPGCVFYVIGQDEGDVVSAVRSGFKKNELGFYFCIKMSSVQ